MNCPRCASPLEDPQARFCPICGASIPAPGESPAPSGPAPAAGGPAPEPAPSTAGPGAPGGAHCAAHPDKPAADICSRCGAFACSTCLVIGADGQGICQACYDREGGAAVPLPWERRKELGFFKAYWQTTKQIMFQPNTAFDRVQTETGQWWDPLSYSIFSNFLNFSGTGIFYALTMGVTFIAAALGSGSKGTEMSAGIIAGIIVGGIFAILIFVPIGAVLNSLMFAGLEHLTLKLVGANVRGYETTLRGYCYSQAPMFWGVVPLCGNQASLIWHLVCRIYAYKAMHKTTGGKAAAGAILPLVVCCGGVGAIYAVIIALSIASSH